MKTLATAIRALKLLAAAPGELGVQELAEALALPKSSVSRLMASLRDGGLAEQNPRTRRYRPGPLGWELGARYRPSGSDLTLLGEAMSHLAETTGFTSWLAVLAGADIIVLRHHQGTTPIQFTVRPGQRLPAHSTAIGKALLARLPERTLASLFGRTLPASTEQTLDSLEALAADLRQVRESGLAFSNQETFSGITAVAVALQGPASDSAVGLGVSFPTRYGDPMSLKHVTSVLRSEAQRLGAAIQDPLWSSRAS